MKKILIGLVLVILIGAGFYVYQRQARAPISEVENGEDQNGSLNSLTPTPSSLATTPTVTPTPTKTQGDYNPPGSEPGVNPDGPDMQIFEVVYNGSSFEPKTLNVRPGDYVFFVNDSGKAFWLVSDNKSSGIDSKAAIAAGKQYKVQFKTIGDFMYYDSLNNEVRGHVIVSK